MDKYNVTKNFYWSEVECKDGTECPSYLKVNAVRLANNLETLRFAIGDLPIRINSWFRTKAHNDTLKYHSPHSQHLQAKAVDIWVKGMKPITLYEIIEVLIRLRKIEDGGLGIYDTICHYDVGPAGRRWDYRTGKKK